ncbi:MAG TPA: hypothetical protein VLX58_11185 [Bryobacteraceae bacterium]|nr:hypothetical protein [Bryobacteraceae bacterium]
MDPVKLSILGLLIAPFIPLAVTALLRCAFRRRGSSASQPNQPSLPLLPKCGSEAIRRT